MSDPYAEADAGFQAMDTGEAEVAEAPVEESFEPEPDVEPELVDEEVTEEEAPLEEVPEEERPVNLGEHKALKNENQQLRARAKEYEAVFNNWEPNSRNQWLDLVYTTGQNPEMGAQMMRELADRLDGGGGPQEGYEEPDLSQMSLAEIRELARQEARQETYESQRQFQEQQQTMQLSQTFTNRAQELGYPLGSEEYTTLMGLVAAGIAPDVDAAHAQLQKVGQRSVDTYVASKQKKAQTTPRPANGSAPTDGVKSPTNFDEADELFKRIVG